LVDTADTAYAILYGFAQIVALSQLLMTEILCLGFDDVPIIFFEYERLLGY
jgi:hypothetical protein